MTAPSIGGGRVTIEAVGQVPSGFRADLQRKIDAAVAGLTIDLPVEVHEGALRTKVAAAAAAAEAGQEVSVDVDADAAGLREEVSAAVAAAGVGQEIKVKVKLDRDRSLLAGVAGAGGVDVVPGDGGRRGGAGGLGLNLGLSAADAALTSFGQHWASVGSALAGNVWVLLSLSGAVAGLTAASGALLGSIAPLVGTLAALPGAAAAGATSIGTLFLGLGGIGEATAALGQEQASGGASAKAYADAQRAAATQIVDAQYAMTEAYEQQRETALSSTQQIRSARENLANTQYALAQRAVQDARTVEAAEYSLVRAYESERDAVEALQDARESAERQLEDSANARINARLGAQAATLALEEARLRASQVLTDPNATALQRREAALAVAEAEQRLAEAEQAKDRAAEDDRQRRREGVEGSEQVRSAEQQLEDARRNATQAARDLADVEREQRHDALIGTQQLRHAQQDLNNTLRQTAEAGRDASHAVSIARRNLADAQRAQTRAAESMGGAASAVEQAMENLSPAARQFARDVNAISEGPLRDLRHAAQTALLPGLGDALDIVTTNLFPAFESMVTDTGLALGEAAVQGAKFVSSGPFTRDFRQLGRENAGLIREMTPGVLDLLDALRRLGMGAMPFLHDMARSLSDNADRLNKYLEAATDDGRLGRFFDKVAETTHLWGRILGNVFVGIGHLMEAAYGPGNELNNAMEATTRHFREWTDTEEGREKVRKFFEEGADLARALARAVGGIARGFMEINNNGQLTDLLDNIARNAPGLGRILGALSGGFATTISVIASALSSIAGDSGPLGVVARVFFGALGALAAGALIAKATGLAAIAKAINATMIAAGKPGLLSSSFGVISKFLASPFGLAAVGIGLVAAATVGLVTSWREGGKEADEFIDTLRTQQGTYNGLLDGLVKKGDEVSDEIGGMWEAISSPFGTTKAAGELDKLTDAMRNLHNNVLVLKPALRTTRTGVLQLATAAGIDLTEALILTDEQMKATRAIGGPLGRMLRAMGQSVGEVKAKVDEWVATNITANSRARRYAATTLLIADYTERAKDKTTAYSDALDYLYGIYLSVGEAGDRAKLGLLNLRHELTSNSRSLADNTRHGIENRDSLRDRVREAMDAAKAIEQKTLADNKSLGPEEASRLATEAGNRELRKRYDALLDQAEALGFNRGEVEKLIPALDLLPRKVQMKIDDPGARAAIANAERITALYKMLEKNPHTIKVIYKAFGNLFGQVGTALDDSFAAGGDVRRGQTILVGEKGPEIFEVPADGRIIPNHEIRQTMHAAAASTVAFFAAGMDVGLKQLRAWRQRIRAELDAAPGGAQPGTSVNLRGTEQIRLIDAIRQVLIGVREDRADMRDARSDVRDQIRKIREDDRQRPGGRRGEVEHKANVDRIAELRDEMRQLKREHARDVARAGEQERRLLARLRKASNTTRPVLNPLGIDTDIGAGLAQVFREGAIKVYNARPEPAAKSVAARLREVRELGAPVRIPSPKHTYEPYEQEA